MSTYHLEVAGLSRELPICKISDKLSIAAFIRAIPNCVLSAQRRCWRSARNLMFC